MSGKSAGTDLGTAWRASLGSPEIRRQGSLAGAWPEPDARLEERATAIRELEATPVRVLKTSHVSRVVRGRLDGQPVILKRFFRATGWKKAANRFRPSRARRCWATSATLRGAGIASSHCIGFLEESGESVAVFAEEPGSVSARRWIKAWLHQRPADFRAGFRDDLARFLLELYRHRVYHADTKASNMLLHHPEDPGQRTFLWIDLDCVHFGVTPSRRRVLRNLVQLNGSVGSKLSDEDRLEFLEALAERFPWVTEPAVAEQIRTRTLERLQRELSGQCGP